MAKDTDEFIRENVSRGTASPETRKTRLPLGVQRAVSKAQESRTVVPVPGIGEARQFMSGFIGTQPDYSVMDPNYKQLGSAYRTGEQASVAADVFGALTPFATASALSKASQLPVIAELIAYHGSPHRFKKFDASKIGTGEGAQAYGHGLYFAENPKVAKQYQADLANYEQPYLQFGKTKIAGQELSDIDLEVLKYLEMGKRDAGQFPHNTVYYAKQAAKNKPEVLKRLDEVGQDVKFGYEKNKGAFYTVDIPDEKIAQMLDWDKPLSQQPAAMQVARKVFNDPQRKSAGFPSITDEEIGNLTGQDLYRAMTTTRGGLQPGASKSLLQEGIPGIKYLDQASRDAKQGTRNFVLFPGEEQNIKMLDINGEPLEKQDGGKVTTEEFIKKNVPRETSTSKQQLDKLARVSQRKKA